MTWLKTSEILLKPVAFKKWLMLGIIILLAGQMGGFNFNLGGNKNDFNKIANVITKEMPAPHLPAIASTPKGLLENIRSMPIFSDPKKAITVVLIIGGILMLLGLLLFLWMWVNANFSFVFIDSVVRNDASLRVPFHRNKQQGNSYLMWNIIFSSAAILILCAIAIPPVRTIFSSGILDGRADFDIAQVFSIMGPCVPPFLVSIFLLVLITLLVLDFMLPIMYGRKTGILSAWAEFFRILRKNLGDILLYLLVRLGLAILAILVSVAILIVGIIIMLIAGGISWLIGWLIYLITPAAAKAATLAVLVVIGAGILIFLGILFSLAFLPIPVFFRILPIYVLASMDESLDLFAAAEKEKLLKQDIGPYKKSMALVWFTVLSPIIVAVLALLAAVAIPHFILAKEKGGEARISEPAKRRAGTKDNLVTVYLRNGNSFTAKIEEESAGNISFAIEGGTFILPRSDILRIEWQGVK